LHKFNFRGGKSGGKLYRRRDKRETKTKKITATKDFEQLHAKIVRVRAEDERGNMFFRHWWGGRKRRKIANYDELSSGGRTV